MAQEVRIVDLMNAAYVAGRDIGLDLAFSMVFGDELDGTDLDLATIRDAYAEWQLATGGEGSFTRWTRELSAAKTATNHKHGKAGNGEC